MYDNILIDGKNIINRVAAASRSGGYECHPITIMVRMMDKWRRMFKPKKWHVFWDVPKTDLWRKDFYPDYKEGRPKCDEEYAGVLKESQTVAALLFHNIKVTQYIKSKNEADDLIYAFVTLYRKQKHIIISSDGDALQIPYHLGVDVHRPGTKHDIAPVPKYDPCIVKALAGDKSDNIQNYRLVADKTAYKIIDNGLEEFLEKKGRELFDHNLKLVDLSKNPQLSENQQYIHSIPENDKFNMQAITRLISKYSIKGLHAELVTKIKPFKNI